MRARSIAAKLVFLPLVLLALASLAPAADAQMINDRPSPGARTSPIAEEPAAAPVSGLRQRIAAAIEELKANWRPQASVSRAAVPGQRTAWTRRAGR